MNDTTTIPPNSALRQLSNFIGSKIIITREFNMPAPEPWSNAHQVSMAILHVKQAIGASSGGNYKQIFFDKWNKVGQSPKSVFIGVAMTSLEDAGFARNSPLLEFAVKALAEVAGQDPDKVTVCPALRAGAWGSVLNLFDKPVCIATADEETAKGLHHFARNAKLKSPIAVNPPVFEMTT